MEGCLNVQYHSKHHRYLPALLVHPAHNCSTQSVGEKGQVRREEAAATIRPVRGPRPGIPANPARARAWRGGDSSLLSPAPLPPLLGFYKTSSLNQGPSCCPASRGPSLAPIVGVGARGPTHSGFEMAPRGLGIQSESSQQGPPGLGERQVPGINIYFLTSWCWEEQPSWAVKPHLALT